MITYCDPNKVIRRVKTFVRDWNDEDETIPRQTVQEAIEEASNSVRTTVGKKFDVLDIESSSPLPPAMVYMAEIKSAIIILDWFGPLDQVLNMQIHDDLKKHLEYHVFQVLGGMLLNSDGEQITPKEIRMANSRNPDLASKIDELYSGGGMTIYDREN